MFKFYAKRIADKMNYLQIQSCCTGGQISYSYMKGGSLSQLSETGTSFQPNEERMREEVARVWPGIIEYLSFTIPITGHVTDSEGKPLRANIDIRGLSWTNNEKRFSNERRKGIFHLWIPNGNYTLIFSSEGYKALTKDVYLVNSLELIIKLEKIKLN
jgi:hypothetical protein